MEKKVANGAALAQRLERIKRLTDELERAQDERHRVQEITERIRREIEEVRHALHPPGVEKAADTRTRRRKR